MARPVGLDEVLSILGHCALAHAVLDLDAGHRLVVVERGGHALGPFDADGRPTLWLNPAAWQSAAAMADFVAAGNWNIGGERYWLAPEIRFTIRDRADYWGSYHLPAAMAPGNYRLAAGDRSVRLMADATLTCFNPEGDVAVVGIERRYRPLANPLRHLSAADRLLDGVAYAGFEHGADLTLRPGSTDGARVESWTLAQLIPDGTLVIPSSEGVEHEDYYEPVDAAHYRRAAGAALLSVTGRRRYKVGFRSPHLTGRLGYLKALPDGRAQLVVRNFLNDPSSDYVEEPADRPGCRGLSVHVYNDGGLFGGFGELECNGRTIGGEAGSGGRDAFAFWQFTGPAHRIRAIAAILLGTGAVAAAGF